MPKAVLWGIGLLVCELPMEGEKCNYFDASADQQVASKKEKKRRKRTGALSTYFIVHLVHTLRLSLDFVH